MIWLARAPRFLVEGFTTAMAWRAKKRSRGLGYCSTSAAVEGVDLAEQALLPAGSLLSLQLASFTPTISR